MRRAVAAVVAAVLVSWMIPAGSATADPPPAAPLPTGPTAAAASPGTAGIGDPYVPLDGNGGYNVAHYDLKVGYTPSTDAISGTTRIRARATKSLSRFNLDLLGLKVDRVRVNGRIAKWKRAAAELRITPAKALRRGAEFTVTVRYHGVPELAEDETGIGGVFPTEDGMIVIGEPHVASTWFPVNDHPADKATYTFRVTVPKALEVVSNGKLASVRRKGSKATWTWVADIPMASYLATATVGQFTIRSYEEGGIRFIDAIDPKLFEEPQPFGAKYAISSSASSAYQRLTRTFTVPGAGGKLSFDVFRDTEPDFDYFFAEAHQVGSSGWTTLPDVNGHSSTDPGVSCPFWLSLHPFLAHYQKGNGEDELCLPTGTTGAWNAASGSSDGFENWSLDLGAYAGQQVEVALSVATDDVISRPGVIVDRIVGPGGQGTTSFEDDGDVMDGWTVAGAPAGSPGNDADWQVGTPDDLTSVGERADRALKREPEIIRFLASIYGRYPFDQAGGIVDRDEPQLGFALENQTRPIYSTAFFEDSDEVSAGVVVHELSHQWTGDSLSVAAWQHIWLNEGFATYAEWLWSEHEGHESAQEIFESFASAPADSFLWQLTIGDPGPANLFDRRVYDRGAMTLHALRLRVGDPAFFRILEEWTTSQRGGHVRTAEFLKLAERISGQELDHFVDEWLFTAAKPTGLDAGVRRSSARDPRAWERSAAHRVGRR